MGSRRVASYLLRVRESLRAAFAEDHPPHHLAVSFAIGVFVTTLPSLGAGVLLSRGSDIDLIGLTFSRCSPRLRY